DFAISIAKVRVLDPACGSGNFLYVALKQLLDLEKEAVALSGTLGLTRFFPTVSPMQLYGIEINRYAHELAQATIWIGYIQWLRENGFGIPSEPILKPLDNIWMMDAVLAYNKQGEPIEPKWPEADVIIGNPPFLGSRRMRPTLGDEYCDSLEQVYRERIGRPDLVCYWFEKARSLIEKGKTKRVGLLATQAIRGGTNRRVLGRIKATGNIFMGWSDREWILDGAMVHVSMVGFDDGSEKKVVLNGSCVSSINSDLTSGIDLSYAKVIKENANLSFQGVVLRGAFSITYEQASIMLEATGNPNGRPNSDVIVPRLIGQDITARPSRSYAIDFGIGTSIEDASQYVLPFEYIKKNVYPVRQQANQDIARVKWWLHWRPRSAMREAISSLKRYIVTSRVSMHRIFVWATPDAIPDTATVVIARDDDYFFGVVHSKPHELWARRAGTQLRDAVSGSRYTSTSCFETFPFPWPPAKEPEEDNRITAVAQAARELVEKRDAWLNPQDMTEEQLQSRTLTSLYNDRPTWLDLAHRKLDIAVLDAYDWPHDLTNEEILKKLMSLNLERAQK
ncbi:MAG TPA: DNA methyltransferase, partial [Patescibacteria group bacterium]|nr:DNA methyltransferase [Patescibacteria group bacterium]